MTQATAAKKALSGDKLKIERPHLKLLASGVVQLIGLVTVDNVAELQKAGFLLIEQADVPIQFELSQLKAEGSVVIALLISWQRHGVHRHKQPSFKAPAENLLAIAEASGVADILNFSPSTTT